MTNEEHTQGEGVPINRRSIVVTLATAAIGSLVALFPVLAGLGVVFHPLRRREKRAASADGTDNDFIRVCSLSALPADGIPHAFPVMTVVEDAWSRTPGQRVGMVYVRHEEEEAGPKIIAFTAECPHLGCSVDFNGEEKYFECPCHVSAFSLDGAKEAGPSLRGLDPLETKITGEEGQQDVWVKFERFRTGIAERIPIG